MTRKMVEFLKIPPEKIITMPWGCNTDIFNNAGIKKNKILRVITTRRLEDIYNWKLFLEAIPYVLEKNKDIQFVHVGGGSRTGAAHELIDKLGIKENVKLLGEMTSENVAEELKKSHVFLTLSFTDGNNISLNEAMACGCFPICGNIPATIQWIRNNENGIILENFEPETLAEHILNVKYESEFVQNSIKNNFAIVKDRCDFKKNLLKMMDMYKKIINGQDI